ncbi:hypothetical protein B0H16DRAFT_334001 [Mycena metata]|uniref:Thiaminase-2/PQQC domain-containing protein n=1 Tax=Mycena metata TaxID=1033252 RepID=A0AAD7NNF3_9AGAR|nr:hypothetical protein B0H16DRAFT_334001 [Mycena metata]
MCERPDTGLVFRPEWYPTPRPRISTVAPLVTRPEGNRFHSWALIVKELKELPAFQQEQPNHPTALPIKATYTPEFPSVPPPSVGSLQMPEPLPSSSRPHLQEDAVAELLRRNRKVFNEVINHSFPQAFGNGTASLDGFRYYMIQDKMYLQTCARLKMKAVSEGSDKDVEEFGVRHKSSLKQIERLKATCVTMLSVPESIIEATLRSVELDTTEQFYKTALRGEDALLAYYVILLPCVLIYWTIAERLMEDPSTVRNVVYHSAWTLENYDRSSVDKYKSMSLTYPDQLSSKKIIRVYQ